MSKKPFKATNWLKSSRDKSIPSDLASDFFQVGSTIAEVPAFIAPEVREEQKDFSPSSYFVPGWKADGLLSTYSVVISKSIEVLTKEAQLEFSKFGSRNKSLKLHVYNEFLSFLNSSGLCSSEVESYSDFWNAFELEGHSSCNLIESFKEIYCFRVVTVYLHKLRFLIKLAAQMDIEITQSNVLNPNSFIHRVFRQASSTELNCESLRPGKYSWFRPTQHSIAKLPQLNTALATVPVTELLKVCNENLRFKTLQQNENASSKFSHTISHKSFGLFTNHLLVNFLKKKEKSSEIPPLPHEKRSFIPSILNTKFVGDHLSSLGLSHWLAQENNASESWTDILCPDFFGETFKDGHFIKTTHEILFLTFLTRMAAVQKIDPVKYITSILKEKRSSNGLDGNGQFTFFASEELQYQRMVLNLSDGPKKNPHHYLLTQISNNGKQLAENGHMVVLSNQKLFVPSQSAKIEQFLKSFKVQAIFDFENLKGLGEVPSNIYIISKRSSYSSSLFKLNQLSQSSKEHCHKFRWTGEMPSFSKFIDFVKELERFSANPKNLSRSLFRKEIDENLSFEFHQDAILGGKLLNSSTNDDSRITHPSFFKGLTTSCIPFDNFFQIEGIESTTSRPQSTNELLGVTLRSEERFPLVLVVNHSDERNIKVELIPAQTYLAKVQEYGAAYFKYFGLIPKRADININVFREFFNGHMGHQIIQLSLSGGDKKIKSKLKSLLVPKFFLETNEVPTHLTARLKFLNQTSEEILKIHPQTLATQIESMLQAIETLSDRYSWHSLSILSEFRYTIERSLAKLNNPHLSKSQSSIYDNPLMIEKLMTLPTAPIYPNNSDLFVSSNITSPDEIHLPLERVQLKSDTLEIYANDKVILELTSEASLLSFVDYILQKSAGTPISAILQGLSIPSLEDLNSTNKMVGHISEELVQTHQKIKSAIAGIFRSKTFA